MFFANDWSEDDVKHDPLSEWIRAGIPKWYRMFSFRNPTTVSDVDVFVACVIGHPVKCSTAIIMYLLPEFVSGSGPANSIEYH